MSKQPFDTSTISIRPRIDNTESKKRNLVVPRLHSNRISHHQYMVNDGDLFTLLIYDKDHERAPYLHRWTANFPNREVSKGDDIFKLEKVSRDLQHRYNVDIYRQKVRIKPDLTYSDEMRRKFPVAEYMKRLGNVLISRQEIDGQGLVPIGTIGTGGAGDGQMLQVFLN